MSRWKACAIHLGISLLVISVLVGIMALTWYPPIYAWAMGGLGLIMILASVDACLGPLLTLIVWNVDKPSLRFDMAVIVCLQVMGLWYGVYTAFLARPIYQVFAVNQFDLVAAVDVPEGELENAIRQEFKSLPLTGPEIIAVQMPTDPAERRKLLFSSVQGGADLAQLPHYYVPYAELAPEAARKAKPLDALTQRDAATRDKLSAYLSSHDLDPAKVKFLPMRAKAHDQTVLVDADTGAVLGIVNIDPWVQ
ncbi:hypothetical protein SAMN02949497_0932 [Methylomagnum ishizawai]|uniref:Type IV pilin accessory protein n=1 Tax=Methylomagnum ishizawai TaxID=1760988 RepID=A0A1Y6D0Y9_9GAMM|nr:TfpX/TfpZ family type IV pilin accessory protein [Methylomagnum ishizawai]SMF93645.1 hypothetical protein SAMN02949497_0932 [Methylomagnum ishizawai]